MYYRKKTTIGIGLFLFLFLIRFAFFKLMFRRTGRPQILLEAEAHFQEQKKQAEQEFKERTNRILHIEKVVRLSKLDNGLTYEEVLQRYLKCPDWQARLYEKDENNKIVCSGVERKGRHGSVKIVFSAVDEHKCGQILSVWFNDKERIGKGQEIFITKMIEYAEKNPITATP